MHFVLCVLLCVCVYKTTSLLERTSNGIATISFYTTLCSVLYRKDAPNANRRLSSARAVAARYIIFSRGIKTIIFLQSIVHAYHFDIQCDKCDDLAGDLMKRFRECVEVRVYDVRNARVNFNLRTRERRTSEFARTIFITKA